MHFVKLIKKTYGKKKLAIFVDMDGVITDYEVGKPIDFKTKRPLLTNIKTIKELSLIPNVELYILSICFKEEQIIEKNNWLDEYAPFFKLENRVIIPKSNYPNLRSKDLKFKHLKKYISKNPNIKVILIDDDNEILKHLSKYLKKVDLYQDSSIID